ncbi:MAG: polyprenyl synthetase family protein [Acidobacteria bacterium]|nr:polyprenyl synthetase family protein [Acidobacteriota bacterium]
MKAALTHYLDQRRALVDEALSRSLPQPPACPAIVSEAMRYSLMAGGKRLRPILTLAAAEAVHATLPADRRGPAEHAIALALPAGCAIELIHTYSLIHDDLPAMDDDEMRRGRPTSHVVYGEGIAILAGDGLLAEAFALMAREPRSAAPTDPLVDRKLRIIRRVADAAGATGMVGGQAIDLNAAGTSSLTDDDLRAMHAMKTGALIRASVAAGAIIVGATDALVDASDRFAAELGLAFQITDDILDVEATSQQMGKKTGKDAALGKPTYVTRFGVERSRQMAADCVARARLTLERAGLLEGYLVDIAEWVVGRRK